MRSTAIKLGKYGLLTIDDSFLIILLHIKYGLPFVALKLKLTAFRLLNHFFRLIYIMI